ncbi:SurA N-terminal domain-containing protein [Micromonospora narathiwatensis]|uniref:SurA N-terminal domain-containing protein n=1 Tax=Micromonospora narathiwatensis TaxID=299146 RepID=A0A1A9ADM8_9ACTN|nr:hypothetical protein [Micromonospora narathiwatensis]SBT54622.1 hypothetical protein GA0070621_5576 [Micromonospora narathiwatensis]
MRARRLTAAASVAALAVLSLAACGRSAPGVAAYVGDRTFSVDRVNEIYDDAQTQYADAVRSQQEQMGATPAPEELRSSVTRQDVVNLLVSVELGKRLADEKGIEIPDMLTPEQLQQQLQLPASTEYVQLWGEWVDISDALQKQLPPAELSDDAVMAVYQAIAQTGAIRAGLSVAEVRQAFGEGGFVRSATALSSALREEAEKSGASINPKYGPIGVPSVVSTGQSLVFYSLPFINHDGPVTDISTPEAPETGDPVTH